MNSEREEIINSKNEVICTRLDNIFTRAEDGHQNELINGLKGFFLNEQRYVETVSEIIDMLGNDTRVMTEENDPQAIKSLIDSLKAKYGYRDQESKVVMKLYEEGQTPEKLLAGMSEIFNLKQTDSKIDINDKPTLGRYLRELDDLNNLRKDFLVKPVVNTIFKAQFNVLKYNNQNKNLNDNAQDATPKK